MYVKTYFAPMLHTLLWVGGNCIKFPAVTKPTFNQ